MMKRVLSFLLAVCMVCSMVPVQVFAAEDCSHHAGHTAECGYAAPVEASPCTHEHDDGCYSAEIACIHTAHDETCGGMEDESLCAHECSEDSGCITSVLSCTHVHDDACGYAQGSEGAPCTFVCTDCAEPEEELTETVESMETTEPTETTKTTESTETAESAAQTEGAEPMLLSTDTTIYLKPGDYWPSGTYDYAVWNWYTGYSGFWVEPTSQSPDGDGWVIFEVEAPNVIFVALTEGSTPDWSNKAYQTADLVLDSSQPYYTLASTTGGSWSAESTCDHSYESVVTTPASCTATGVRTYTCSLCGSSYTETIAKTEHTLDDNGTCTACGATPGMVFVSYTHLFPEDQFDCYAWVWPASGSGGSRWVSPAGSQTVEGYTAFQVEENDDYVIFLIVPQWAEPSWNNRVTQTQDILIDDATYETLHGPYTQGTLGAENKMDTYSADQPCAHSWSESTTASSGCTTDGRRIFDCASCGASANIVLPATGHSAQPEELTVIIPASCTTDGSSTYTCENCQQTVTVTIPATGHKHDESGVCSVCGDSPTIECTYNGTIAYFDDLVSAYRHSGNGTYYLKLLKDVTLESNQGVPITVYEDNPLELDLNGHTLSAYGQGYGAIYLSDGHATVKNGTIALLSNTQNVFFIQGDNAKLTLTDVTFTPAEGATLYSPKCVYQQTTGSCELTRVKTEGNVYYLLLHTGTGSVVLNDCQTYDASLGEEANAVYAANGTKLTVNGGKYQYLTVMDGVGTALPEGYWYRYLADGTYVPETVMTGARLHGVEVVPIPLTPTLAETADAILGQPLTLEPTYTANATDFDSTALTVTWDYDETYFTADGNTLIPTAVGETEVTCTYSYKGYTVQVPVTVIIEQQYTVTFEMNGHGDAIDSQTVTENGNATEPAVPTAAGYSFGGWYTDAGCTTAFDFSTPITGDITLYAKWTVAHSHDGTPYMEWTATSGNVESGNYYLSGDITATGGITIPIGATVTLCLNGGTLDMTIYWFIENNGTLNICDCTGNGKLTGCNAGNGNVILNKGSLSVSSGTIEGTGNTACGINNQGGTVTVTGGTILSNSTCGIYNAGTLTISGGSVRSLSSNSYGIGIHNDSGTLYLSGNPSISGTMADLRYTSGTITAQIGDTAYSGDALTVLDVSGAAVGDVLVQNAAPEQFTLVYKACHVLAQGTGDNAPHLVVAANHTWDTLWTSDSTAHWHECTVDGCTIADNSQKDGYKVHTGQGTSNEDGTHNVNCTVCAVLLEENVPCVHDHDCDTDCNICGATRTITHQYGDNGICTVCGSFQPAQDSDGDGCYEITNAGNLWWFSQQVNSGYNNRSLNAILTADIDLAGTCGEGLGNWEPISTSYSGHFDGQGHTVSNLYMSGDELYVGLFGYVDGATIENVTVTGSVSSTLAFDDDYNMAASGGIVAWLNAGTIRNCHTNMTVSGVNSIGGICGVMWGGLIEGCTAQGEVTCPADIGRGMSLGGIVGCKYDGTVRSCVNRATINPHCTAYFGGVAGSQSCGVIENCLNYGTICSDYTDGYSYSVPGGIVGNNAAVIRNCGNLGSITVASDGQGTGGIAGIHQELGGAALIENCYTVGTVTVGSGTAGAIFGDGNGADGTVSNSYYLSDTETEDGGRTADQFASGQVTYELNGSVTGEDNIWRQTIGTDTYPVFSGPLVYYGTHYSCDGTAEDALYHNKEPNNAVPEHSFNDNGFCTVCDGYEPAKLVEGVYQITNGGNLFWFAELVNGGESTANALLTADIDLESREWAPIDNYTGTFDGGGHSITNLLITTPATRMGFFGRTISPAVIKNFTISGLIQPTGSGDCYIGGVAVDSGDNEVYNGSTISNVVCDVDMDASAGSVTRMGGIVTSLYGGTVSQCLYTGSITGSANDVGGVVGYARQGTIQNCGVTGIVSSSNHVGGILGYVNNNDTYVTNCYCAGYVNSTAANRMGAIIGRARSNFDVAKATNNYYFDSDQTAGAFGSACEVTFGETAAIGKTQEAFLSGEVTWRLNGESSEGIWKQSLNGSSLPGFSGGTVYFNNLYLCDGTAYTEYSNTQVIDAAVPPHQLDEDGTCTNCGMAFKAMVTLPDGTVSYHERLAEALTEASGQTGSTLKLLTDVDSAPDISGDFTLDLNGKNLSFGSFTVRGDANLTVCSSVEGGTISGIVGETISVYGSFTLESGTLLVDEAPVLSIGDSGTVRIAGGTLYLTGTSEYDIIDGTNYSITGGMFKADYGPVYVGSAVGTVSGGTFVNGIQSASIQALLADGAYLVDENGTPVAIAQDTWIINQTVTVIPNPHTHTDTDNNGHCDNEQCGMEILVKVTDSSGQETLYVAAKPAWEATQAEGHWTVTLMADISFNNTVFLGSNEAESVTLDLNGKALTCDDVHFYGSSALLRDSGTGGTISGWIVVDSATMLTVTGGTIQKPDAQEFALEIAGSSTTGGIQLSGGTFVGGLQVHIGSGYGILADYLAPGYAYQKADGTCTVNATMTSLTGTVTVVSVPWLAINEVNFPDDNFRTYVSENCDSAEDTDNPGYLTETELLAVTEMNLSMKSITSLAGIQYFTELETLKCYLNTSLAELDVSKNTKLVYLNCSSTKLTKLDVSQNTALEYLDCSGTSLTTLDVSQNAALTTLACFYSELTALDVSQNAELTVLECYRNNLTELNVSGNAKLVYLDCGYNELTNLDVSQNTDLEYLDCSGTGLTSLDVSNNSELTDLSCSDNQLTALDVSHNPKLTYLACNDNKLTNLDVSQNTALEYLYCYNNGLTALDVSQHTALIALQCNDNGMSTLVLPETNTLKALFCYNNALTTLDVSKNPALERLQCENNHLTELDLTGNTALGYFIGSGQTTHVTLSPDGTADLSELGDTTKMTLSSGGTMENGIVTPEDGAAQIVYTYSTGSEKGDLEVTVSLLAAGTVSVDITWGAMEFTYTDGKWNPDTLSYEGGGWKADAEGGNAITVTNSGADAVAVSVSYTQAADYTAISGSFGEPTAALAAGEEKKFYLLLSGKPESELSGTALGTVTLTIGGE